MLVLLQYTKVIYAYMGFAGFSIFFVLTGIIVLKLLQKAEIHLDIISFCYILFNFAVSRGWGSAGLKAGFCTKLPRLVDGHQVHCLVGSRDLAHHVFVLLAVFPEQPSHIATAADSLSISRMLQVLLPACRWWVPYRYSSCPRRCS